MPEQRELPWPSKKERLDRKNLQNLVQETIEEFSKSQKLIEEYLEKVWLDEKLFKQKRNKPIMVKIVTLCIVDYMAKQYGRALKEEMMELEEIAKEKIEREGGYEMMKGNYLLAFHKINIKNKPETKELPVEKEDQKKFTPDWRERAAGDHTKNGDDNNSE